MTKRVSGLAGPTAIVLAATLTLVPPASAESAVYEVDPVHTSVYFKISHLGFSSLFGRFNSVDGSVVFDPDDPEAGGVKLIIEAASVDTKHEERDEHLRSPDFFNSREFPRITFRSTRIEATGNSRALVTGDLTLLGVTRPVTMEVTYNAMGPYPFVPGQIRIGFSATGSVRRSDFGMTYQLDNVGDEVTLFIEVEAFR
jgi:polyisoprenoid-binding protein YceI